MSGKSVLGAKPVAVELSQAAKKVRHTNLKAQQPQAPAGHPVGPVLWLPPDVQRPQLVGGQKDHDEGDETNQVKMIEVLGLFQQEDVAETDKEKNNALSIPESKQNE